MNNPFFDNNINQNPDPKQIILSWIQRNGGTISIIIALVGIFWAIHQELMGLNSRISNNEGKLEVIMYDKQNQTNNNFQGPCPKIN